MSSIGSGEGEALLSSGASRGANAAGLLASPVALRLVSFVLFFVSAAFYLDPLGSLGPGRVRSVETVDVHGDVLLEVGRDEPLPGRHALVGNAVVHDLEDSGNCAVAVEPVVVREVRPDETLRLVTVAGHALQHELGLTLFEDFLIVHKRGVVLGRYLFLGGFGDLGLLGPDLAHFGCQPLV